MPLLITPLTMHSEKMPSALKHQHLPARRVKNNLLVPEITTTLKELGSQAVYLFQLYYKTNATNKGQPKSCHMSRRGPE
jgi:hypothetical protein